MMEAQDKPVEELPSPEITTALLDLAQLSHRIALAAAESRGTIAAALLERLMMLCKAEQGAIVIPAQSPGEQQPLIWSSARKEIDGAPARSQSSRDVGPRLRTLALHAMEEEKALALLAGYFPHGPPPPSPSHHPSSLTPSP